MGAANSSPDRVVDVQDALAGHQGDLDLNRVFLFRAAEEYHDGQPVSSVARGVSVTPDGGFAIKCDNGVCYRSRLNLRAPPGESPAVAVRVKPEHQGGPALAKIVVFHTDPRKERPAELNGSGYISPLGRGPGEADLLSAWLARALQTGALQPWTLVASDALHGGVLANALSWDCGPDGAWGHGFQPEADGEWQAATDEMMDPSGGRAAPGNRHRQQHPQGQGRCGPRGLALQLPNKELVEVDRRILERCLRLQVAADKGTTGEICGKDVQGNERTFSVLPLVALAGFPKEDADATNAEELSHAFDVLLGDREPWAEQAGMTKEQVLGTRRIHRLWRYFSCSKDDKPLEDRNWIPLNVLTCFGCKQAYRGNCGRRTSQAVWTNCNPDCPAGVALCRACTLKALSAPPADEPACPLCRGQFPIAADRAVLGPDLVVQFPDRSVRVDARAIQNCALLLSFALASDQEPVSHERLLPARVTADQFDKAMGMLPGEASEAPYAELYEEDAEQAEAVFNVHRWLGCLPGEGDGVVRDWVVPNPYPCVVCDEAFAGRSTGPFWRCVTNNCPSLVTLCRVCTTRLLNEGKPCPTCRGPPL